MKITVQVPDEIINDLKTQAEAERKSVSALVADCIGYYVNEKKKKGALKGFVKMAGKTKVEENAVETLERWRTEK